MAGEKGRAAAARRRGDRHAGRAAVPPGDPATREWTVDAIMASGLPGLAMGDHKFHHNASAKQALNEYERARVLSRKAAGGATTGMPTGSPTEREWTLDHLRANARHVTVARVDAKRHNNLHAATALAELDHHHPDDAA